MIIQWFPGHMSKALRKMREESSKVDAIIYVLDSRAPTCCINPEFTKLVGDKPIVYVFNKIDLADENKVVKISKQYISQTTSVILMNSTQSGIGEKISQEITKLCSKKLNKFSSLGIKVILRAMVIGVPNSGKSTLVNNLAKKSKVITGDKPGVTKSNQWIKISNYLEVLDTPGTLCPSFENQEIARNLAYLGSIRDQIIDIIELAQNLIIDINKTYPKIIDEKYKINTDDFNADQILKQIASAKSLVQKGGEPDIERTANMIIDDFRKGKLGRITL